MKEQLQDLLFPVNGVNLLHGFGAQQPGTTPVGINVRAFESITQRGRGGSRPGLSRYILPQLPTGAKIQDLDYIVDPQGTALLANFQFPSPTSTTNDPSTNPPGSVFGDGVFRNPGNVWPTGGSGIQPNRNVQISINPGKHRLTITADDQDKEQGQTFTFTGTEYTQTGLQTLDTIDSLTITSSGAAAGAAAGNYAIAPSNVHGTVDGGGSFTDKYDVHYVNGVFTVGAKPRSYVWAGFGSSSGLNDVIFQSGQSISAANPLGLGTILASYPSGFWRIAEYKWQRNSVSDPINRMFVGIIASGTLQTITQPIFTGPYTGDKAVASGVPNSGSFEAEVDYLFQVSLTGTDWTTSPIF